MKTPGLAAVLLAAGATVAAAGGLWFAGNVFVERDLPAGATSVIVPAGATGDEIAALLARSGAIGSPLAFEILARLRREQDTLKAGEFRFPARANASDVLQEVATGGGQIATWVTIPEGFTANEIAATLAAHGFGPAAALREQFRRGSLVFAGRRTPSLEGYLFPDSYLIPTHAAPPEIADIFTSQFFAKLPPGATEQAEHLGLTIPQIVTLASLVEREGQADDERPLIAGVYYNRLHRGMTLDVDASLEYTFARHKDVITYRDLASDSPYNTYRHLGLPPTPIANPGLPSLLAALHPRASGYLYYVAMGNGHHAFSRTLAEHNANVARYLR